MQNDEWINQNKKRRKMTLFGIPIINLKLDEKMMALNDLVFTVINGLYIFKL